MDMLSREREELRSWKRELASIKADLRRRGEWCGIKAGFDPGQPRDDRGRWSGEGGGGVLVEAPVGNDLSASRNRTGVTGATDFSAARRRTSDCDAQYERDAVICRLVQTPLCWQQAMTRRAACISGGPIPPLNF